MFDIGWTEIAIIVVVGIIVIGPKDLPHVLRLCGQMIGKAKALTREFRGHIDDIIRESELDEVKRQIDKIGETDAQGMIENTIDPDHQIREAMDFSGEEFSNPLGIEKDSEKNGDDDLDTDYDWDDQDRSDQEGADQEGGDPAPRASEKSEP